jgi:hypothetical protein
MSSLEANRSIVVGALHGVKVGKSHAKMISGAERAAMRLQRRRAEASGRRRRHGLLALAPILSLWAIRPAWGDHGGATTPVGGFGFGWLVVSGAVAALALALWAFFAPERPDVPPRDPPTGPPNDPQDRSKADESP